jgi:catalase
MRPVRTSAIATALIAAVTANSNSANATEPQSIIDAFGKVFGNHKARASGAKGQCVAGMFTPTADAKQLTKSISFQNAVPVLGRFSMGGGNPKIADATKAAVRGFSFKLDPGGKGSTDIVTISAPMFFAKSPEQMLGFLEARFPGPDGKPDPEKIKAFTAANPETARQGQWLAGRPVPASYVGVSYWAIHAYTAMNAAGRAQKIKFKLVPTGGEAGLTDEEAKTRPADYLVAELAERIKTKAPAGFDVMAIIGEASDRTNDPTVMWTDEEKRKTIKLGTITVTRVEKNELCDAGIFDPTNLADGIAGPKDDPMFLPRQPTYAISFSRRLN